MPELDPTEDTSASNWVSALENNEGYIDESELVWYDSETPVYSGDPTPAQIEAARRFTSQWLNTDSKGFVIPGSEWGRSLKHWLHILVATPAPGPDQDSSDLEKAVFSAANRLGINTEGVSADDLVLAMENLAGEARS